MDFDLTEDQKEIKRVAHELLGSRSPWARVREAAEAGRYDDALWQELIELGWPGIAVPEEHGGQGLGLVELAVLAEELGYALAAAPLVSTGAVAAALAAAAEDDVRARLLPGIVAGSTQVGFGTRELAADAAGADAVVLLDGDEAVLVESPAGEPFAAIDPTRRYGTVSGGTNETQLGPRCRRRDPDRARGRDPRRLPARARHDARVRQGPQAVRRRGRLLPGRLAPLRADAARHRERPLDGLFRRLGGRRRPRAPPRGGGARRGGRRRAAGAR